MYLYIFIMERCKRLSIFSYFHMYFACPKASDIPENHHKLYKKIKKKSHITTSFYAKLSFFLFYVII